MLPNLVELLLGRHTARLLDQPFAPNGQPITAERATASVFLSVAAPQLAPVPSSPGGVFRLLPPGPLPPPSPTGAFVITGAAVVVSAALYLGFQDRLAPNEDLLTYWLRKQSPAGDPILQRTEAEERAAQLQLLEEEIARLRRNGEEGLARAAEQALQEIGEQMRGPAATTATPLPHPSGRPEIVASADAATPPNGATGPGDQGDAGDAPTNAGDTDATDPLALLAGTRYEPKARSATTLPFDPFYCLVRDAGKMAGSETERTPAMQSDFQALLAFIQASNSLTSEERANLAGFLAERGFNPHGDWVGQPQAALDLYGRDRLAILIHSADSIAHFAGRIGKEDPLLGQILHAYLLTEQPDIPIPSAIAQRPGLARHLARLMDGYRHRMEGLDRGLAAKEEVRPLLTKDLLAAARKEVLHPPDLATARRRFHPVAERFRNLLEVFNRQGGGATVEGMENLDTIIENLERATSFAEVLSALRSSLLRTEYVGLATVAGRIRALQDRAADAPAVYNLPQIPGLQSAVFQAIRGSIEETWKKHPSWGRVDLALQFADPKPERWSDTEYLYRWLPRIETFAEQLRKATDLSGLHEAIAQGPIAAFPRPYSPSPSRDRSLMDRTTLLYLLTQLGTGEDYSPNGLPSIFGLQTRARALSANVPAVQARRAIATRSLTEAHDAIFALIQGLEEVEGSAKRYNAAELSAIARALLAGEPASLLELPHTVRSIVEAYMRKFVEVQRAAYPEQMAPNDNRNPWTHEYLGKRGQHPAAEYRLALMVQRVADGDPAIAPPAPQQIARVVEWAHRHLRPAAAIAADPATVDVVGMAVRKGFEDAAFLSWADQFWRAASPQDKRLALELYFGHEAYREVDEATAERLTTWVGHHGAWREVGFFAHIGADGVVRYRLAMGDLFWVAPTNEAQDVCLEHTHPEILMTKVGGGLQGVYGATVALDAPASEPSPATDGILPSEPDLSFIRRNAETVANAAAGSPASALMVGGKLPHRVLSPNGGTYILYDPATKHYDLYWATNPARGGLDDSHQIQRRILERWAGSQQATIAFHQTQYDHIKHRRLTFLK